MTIQNFDFSVFELRLVAETGHLVSPQSGDIRAKVYDLLIDLDLKEELFELQLRGRLRPLIDFPKELSVEEPSVEAQIAFSDRMLEATSSAMKTTVSKALSVKQAEDLADIFKALPEKTLTPTAAMVIAGLEKRLKSFIKQNS